MPSQGIFVRHQAGCRKQHQATCAKRTDNEAACSCGAKEARCNCSPQYQAHVWIAAEQRRVRKTFPTLDAARGWRHDALSGIKKGTLPTQTRLTIRQAGQQLLADLEAGVALSRSGQRFKPSTVRGYRHDLEACVFPAVGAIKLADLRRGHVQAIVDRLISEGKSASKVRNAIMPLRLIVRRALERDEITTNPCSNVRLPAVDEGRTRAVDPSELTELLDVLPPDVRPIYATAALAGLRRGELRGLRWDDVDLANGVIHVRRGWDDGVGEIAPKSKKGSRKVPLVGALRDELAAHKAQGTRDGEAFVFGRTASEPFTPTHVRKLAEKAWAAENARRTEEAEKTGTKPTLLEPIGLHECRHSYASVAIAAGVNAKSLQSFMGHSSIETTFNLYGHLLAGAEEEAASLLDSYLSRANTGDRLAQLATEEA